MRETRREAMLLLGPTASGKTPLGRLLELRGLGPRRCAHFDFGQQLREAASGGAGAERFSPAEIQRIRDVLERHALLENQDMSIAQRVLQTFVAARAPQPSTLLILNGLPRHLGQAKAVDAWIRVRWVVHLQCDEAVVLARIAANAGGDRTERPDDAPEAVRRKLQWYAERTAPLVDHYRAQGAQILPLRIRADMTPDDAWRLVTACCGG